MKYFVKLLAALSLILSANFASAAPISIEHVQGTTEIAQTPQNIVVFDLASLDNLTRLGIDIAGVPESPFPAYLEQYSDARYPKLGTLFEPNYEQISALNPDLIIIAGRSAPKYAELARIAPTIDLTVSTENYLDDVKRNLHILGTIFNKQQQIDQEIANLDSSMAELAEKAASQGSGLLIMTSGGKMSAYGPGSRFGLLYSGFGIQPVEQEISVGNHGQPISPEFILKTDPDWLFVIDRDAAIGRSGQAAAQLLDNVIVRNSKAWQQDHIVYLDPVNWYLVGGGLSGLHETIDQIEAAFTKNNH